MASSNKDLLIVCSLIAMSLYWTDANGQDNAGAVGMINTGYISTRHSTTAINSLVSNGVNFRNGFRLVGAEGYYCYRRAIVSLFGNIGFQDAQPEGADLVEPFLWTAHTGFGWIISKHKRFALYPAVGIGATGLSVTRYKYPSYEEEDLRTVTPSIDLAFHFDYLFTNPYPGERVTNGIVIGMKFGYNRSFNAVQWTSEGNGGPSMSSSQFQGWYATVSVGGLAFMRKK